MASVTIIENLKDSTSKSLNVDGSSANKTYSYSPSSGSVAIEGIICLFNDSGTVSFNKFGSTTALTNGLVISVTINAVTTILTTIKDNADFATRFERTHFGSSASDTLGSPVGFGESYDAFVGFWKFSRPILLTGSESIQVVVKDNLTSISTLEFSCLILKDL